MKKEGTPTTIKNNDLSLMAIIIPHKAENISISRKWTIDGQGRILDLDVSSLQPFLIDLQFIASDINYDMSGPAVSYFYNPHPSSITGIPGYKVENVILENIEITYPGRASKGYAYVPITGLNQVAEKIKDYPEFSMFGEMPAWYLYVRHVDRIKIKNLNMNLKGSDYRPPFVFDDVSD